ncbi:MAG: fibronectin type III domain-containing protein, partial [Desulfobacteraceae bacterium]|nr:fibronectin type III domain-containing protein [Desulfobacteraceae bacterium]
MFNPNRICFVFKISVFILCVLTALALPPAHAAEVVLSWQSPDDSRVDGYHIYWGPEGYSPDPNQPDTTINDPDATTYTITGLSPSTDYQVSATSFDSDTDPET